MERLFNEGKVCNDATTAVNSSNGLLLILRLWSLSSALRSGGSALRLLSERSKASSKTNFSKIGSKESISSISLLTLKRNYWLENEISVVFGFSFNSNCKSSIWINLIQIIKFTYSYY